MLIARQQSLPMSASATCCGTLLPLVSILEISRISRHWLYPEIILIDIDTTGNSSFNHNQFSEEFPLRGLTFKTNISHK